MRYGLPFPSWCPWCLGGSSDLSRSGTVIEVEYPRRKTRPVRVGRVTIGGGHPVVVQSMITSDTRDVAACVEESLRMAEAGCEIVRVTAPSLRDAQAIAELKAEL